MARKRSIATLGVSLIARTSTFKQRMGAARQILKRFSAGVLGGAKALAKMGTAVVAVGAAITVALIKKQFTAIDSLAKVAGSLSITTEKLAGFRLAAKFAGVETKAMDKALQVMTKNIGEAAGGTGEAKDALESLGFEVNSFSALRADQQFEKIAGALGRVAFQSRRAALASDIFGRAGINLLNIVKGGASALRDAERDALQFGLAVSNVAARQVEDANDSFARLGAVMTGIFRQAATQIAPFAKAFSESMVDMARDGDTMADRVLGAFQSMSLGIADVIVKMKILFFQFEIFSRTAGRRVEILTNFRKRPARRAFEEERFESDLNVLLNAAIKDIEQFNPKVIEAGFEKIRRDAKEAAEKSLRLEKERDERNRKRDIMKQGFAAALAFLGIFPGEVIREKGRKPARVKRVRADRIDGPREALTINPLQLGLSVNRAVFVQDRGLKSAIESLITAVTNNAAALVGP